LWSPCSELWPSSEDFVFEDKLRVEGEPENLVATFTTEYLKAFGVGVAKETATGSSSSSGDLLFDYENRGILYDMCIRLPINIFNSFRKVFCAKFSRNCIGGTVSLFASLVMLFITYYTTYWFCILLIMSFNYLVNEFDFSPGETYLVVIDGGYIGFLAINFTFALLYFARSHEISLLFTRFEDEYLPEYKGNRKFNELGVTFSLIDDFIEQIGGREEIAGLTTTEVSDLFMKERNEVAKMSYSEMKHKEGSEEVRKANVFVSHAWRYRFLDVIDALKAHFSSEDLSNIVIWFDLFSNNQNQTDDIPFEWWCGTFQHSIHSIGRTVAVFLPWENPIPLSRVWCLWEIFISQKTKVKFEIAMSPNEENRFLEMISKDPDAFNVMLSNVDVEKSTSFKPSDREKIFNVIQSTVGFRTVNQDTIKCIKNSILTRLQSRVENQLLASSARTSMSVDSGLSHLRSLCLTLKDIGDYEGSLTYCKKYVKT
jgi:hypothetical protein